jgi:LacI family transcriptional regulator
MRYILHALNAAGIHIPRQVAVAGFDDFEMADVFQPALTVVRQPIYQLGEVAANLLFQRISGSDPPKVGHRVILPVELIVRCSCGCQPRTSKAVKEQHPVVAPTSPEDNESMPLSE